MTPTEQPTNSEPQQEDNNVLAASFFAVGPDDGVIVVQGPPTHVLVAHAVLHMHGYRIAPRAGEFWSGNTLEMRANEDDQTGLVQTAAVLVQEVFSEIGYARAVYFYEYLDELD